MSQDHDIESTAEVEPTTAQGLDSLVEQTKQKILHILAIYPGMSHTMIQTGIGTSTSPKLWKPILAKLLADGEIVEERVTATTPHDRHQVYTVYHLKSFDYQAYRSTLNPTQTPEPQSTIAA